MRVNNCICIHFLHDLNNCEKSQRVCVLAVVLLLACGTMDVHAWDKLELFTPGGQAFYEVGDRLEATFVVDRGIGSASGIKLIITHNGLTDVVISNGGVTDDSSAVTLRGILLVEKGAYVSALWVEAGKEVREYFNGVPVGINSATIVVNPPDPRSELKVGDTFTQTIEVQKATDLAGWQMDIAFNPDVLEVIEIAEGNFLKQDETNTFFSNELSPGKISVKQVRVEAESGVSGSGVLVALKLRFVSFSEALLGLQNVRLSDSSGDRLSYSVNLTPVVATHASAAAEDVNQDGEVNILDLVAVAASIGAVRPSLRADVNDDDSVDVLDLVAIAGSPHWGKSVPIVQIREPNAAAPAASVSLPTPETIREWITLAQLKSDGSLRFQRGIANLESILASKIPSETRLRLNYPNPFNPETWIPYQLSEAADVTVTIRSMNGSLIRTLVLGHQSAGIYKDKSQAAYWDGRNAFGEPVASGLYFYTLMADDFTATRKMLIRK